MPKQRRIQMVLTGDYIDALESERKETGMSITSIFKQYLMLGQKLRQRRKEGWRVLLERDREVVELV